MQLQISKGTLMAREEHQCVSPFSRSRRTLLSRAACGFGSVAAAHLLSAASPATAQDNSPQVGERTHFPPRAVSVIFLYMDGGVSPVEYQSVTCFPKSPAMSTTWPLFDP
jgi:hypothetical protein